MEDWKIRLIDEHIALKERVSKLTKFLDENKDHEDFDILSRQLVAMMDYLKALEERIKNIVTKIFPIAITAMGLFLS
jgi:hypothetical protein